MKKFLFSLCTLLMIVGWHGAWAEEVTFDFSGKLSTLSDVTNTSTSLESYPITLTFTSVNTSRKVQVNQTDKIIKFQGPSGDNEGSSLTVSCPTGGMFAITKVEIHTENSNINSFSVSNGSYTTAEVSSGNYKGTWTDEDAGNITSVTFQTTSNVDNVKSFIITYTDNRSVLSTTDFKFNRGEEDYEGTGGRIQVNSTAFNTGDADPFEFVYDATRTTLRVKLNILTTMTASDFSVTSSDADVLDVSSVTLRKPHDNRVYVEGILVKSAGTANLTFTYQGSETYKPADRTVTFNVKAPNTTFAGNYKYTWTFNDGVWENSKLQAAYYTNSYADSDSRKWTINTTDEARNVGNIPADNGIEKIQGLAFTAVDGLLCLDWTNNCIWLAGSVTIPNLVKGQVITFTAVTGATITCTNNSTTLTESSGTYTYTVTDNAPDGLTFSVNGKHIYSIAVSNSQYGWEYTTESAILDGTSRKIKGTFTFTEEGPIAGGKVIDEVPGITMTVGTSIDSWNVRSATAIDGYNLGAAAAYNKDGANRPTFTSGCFYKFEPIVNGELKVRYYTVNEVYFSEGETTGNKLDGTRVQEKTEILEAGKTYYLSGKGGGLFLNSFTFTPKFFAPGTTTDQLTEGNFIAHVNDPLPSAFPKLIDPTSEEQQDRVKFAGDRTMVHLYKNNDVEIIGTGTNVLIRGTVLDKHNEDGLVAYYYLNSYVLNVTNYEKDDQAYIETSGLTDDNYQFEFSGNIQAANGGGSTVTVQVKKDNGASENVTATITNNILYVPFASLEEGATYKMTIPENTLALTSETTTKNSEIIRTFSVNKAGELQLKMVYPTDIATVGTTIVLETYVNGSTSGLTLNDGAKVKAVLSAYDEEDMEIDATFSGNYLSFKPTHTLKYNKDYTLTYTYVVANNVITSKEVGSTIYQVTHNKVFTFTTGSSSGTAPKVVASSPTKGALVPGSAYSSGRISFTFDQTVDLEPYSEIRATPINGGESTATASTFAPVQSGQNPQNTLKIGDDGKTIYFDYSADAIKYDLYYEVVIPANTVVGVGGLPNREPIALHFRMGMNPNATPVNPATFYPHTWDFNKLGDKTVATTTAYNIVNNYGDPGTASLRVNSLIQSPIDGYTCYTTKGQDGYGFDQGNDIYFNNKNQETEVLDEFEGIRISLVSNHNNRFELRNLTSNGGGTNTDGTDKWEFRMIGNTHYLTLSNVPAGKLYMVVNGKHIGINSPNAVYESVSGSGYGMENENTLLNTNGSTRKVAIDVTEAGDVTFCVKDFSCEKIGVSAFSKTFKPNYVDGGKTYASDCQAYDVRYDLTNEFTDDALKAFYISGITDNVGENTAYATAVEASDNNNAIIKGGEGTILVYQGAANTEKAIPLFKTDVNTAAPAEVSNELIGSTEDNTAVDFQNGYYNYVLSYGGSGAGGTEYGVGFYRYRGTTIGANKAYMQVKTEYVDPNGTAAAKSIRLVFDDDDDDISGIVNVHDADTPNDGYYYHLNGVRVMNPAKGVYIKNGKKIVIK